MRYLDPESRFDLQESVRRTQAFGEKPAQSPASIRESGGRSGIVGISARGNGAGQSVAEEQYRGRALQGQPGTAIHRGDANGVVARIQATGIIQRLESLCAAVGAQTTILF